MQSSTKTAAVALAAVAALVILYMLVSKHKTRPTQEGYNAVKHPYQFHVTLGEDGEDRHLNQGIEPAFLSKELFNLARDVRGYVKEANIFAQHYTQEPLEELSLLCQSTAKLRKKTNKFTAKMNKAIPELEDAARNSARYVAISPGTYQLADVVYRALDELRTMARLMEQSYECAISGSRPKPPFSEKEINSKITNFDQIFDALRTNLRS